MLKSLALLRLRDGNCFHGHAYGYNRPSVGEVVFNTSMTGYQEILTDPSYAKQIITFTYPHIGNVGVNDEDYESSSVFAAGAIIRNPSLVASNYRSKASLESWMQEQQIPGIVGLDTRALTRHIREHGAQDGALVHYNSNDNEKAIETAKELLANFSGLQGADLAKVVTCKKSYNWQQGSWFNRSFEKSNNDRHIVVYDFGVKRNILRLLADKQVRITVVPATTTAQEVLALNPDGVLLSNGPGDPEPCDYAIHSTKQILANDIPVFGICLGFQILSLALGGTTEKMKFGHHGANHPVTNLRNDRVYITSQNHGFAVSASSLEGKAKITHTSLFDGSPQGFVTNNAKAFGFQGHPEASPGPQDIDVLFHEFIKMTSNA